MIFRFYDSKDISVLFNVSKEVFLKRYKSKALDLPNNPFPNPVYRKDNFFLWWADHVDDYFKGK